jgi:hypothetical protein
VGNFELIHTESQPLDGDISTLITYATETYAAHALHNPHSQQALVLQLLFKESVLRRAVKNSSKKEGFPVVKTPLRNYTFSGVKTLS